jgi:ABC-type multidrug transport system permease subunit
MVLSKGACIYFGPRAEVIPYFESLGFPLPIDKAYPDFIEELSAIPHKFHSRNGVPVQHVTPPPPSAAPVVAVANTPSPLASWLTLDAAVTGLVAAYRHSEAYDHVASILFGDMSASNISKRHQLSTSDDYRYNTSFLTQIKLTLSRQFIMLSRTSTALRASVISYIIASLVIGSLFWNLGNAQADARTRFGVLFFVLDFTAVGQNALVPASMMNRAIYYPQSHRGFFRSSSYYIAEVIATIPIGILESMIMSLIVYPMVGLYGDTFISENWWYFWFDVFLFMQTAKAFYMAIGASMPSIPVGMSVAPTLLVIVIFFCGFLAPRSSIPEGWRWLNTISFETYAIKGLAVNEIYNLKWTCNPGETLIPELDTCQLVDGHDGLRLYDMDVSEEHEKYEFFPSISTLFVIKMSDSQN